MCEYGKITHREYIFTNKLVFILTKKNGKEFDKNPSMARNKNHDGSNR